MSEEGVLEQNKEYIDSLNNAQIVQKGLLPKKRHFKRLFSKSFVFYQPKQIISGDFFWVGGRHNLRYLVVGDCTGHGISAALISVLALNLLEYVIMNKGIKKTNNILKEVDKKFIESFKQSDDAFFDNPWIDISIVCVDDDLNKLYFSSANRRMLHIDNAKTMTTYKGSRYPIGGWQVRNNRRFESEVINFEKGDCIYLGSDGYQDQMGGELNKKYKSQKLHDFLAKNSHLDFDTQSELLEIEFLSWKKTHQQTDDICIVGIKL